jgi:hypothetical protein
MLSRVNFLLHTSVSSVAEIHQVVSKMKLASNKGFALHMKVEDPKYKN